MHHGTSWHIPPGGRARLFFLLWRLGKEESGFPCIATALDHHHHQESRARRQSVRYQQQKYQPQYICAPYPHVVLFCKLPQLSLILFYVPPIYRETTGKPLLLAGGSWNSERGFPLGLGPTNLEKQERRRKIRFPRWVTPPPLLSFRVELWLISQNCRCRLMPIAAVTS